MASLCSHVNVWESCLQILRRHGWALRVVPSPDDEGQDAYEAVLGDIDLLADNPIELLGFAAIHDEVRPAGHAPYWWVVKPTGGEERLHDRLVVEARARQEARAAELAEQRRSAPEAWVARLREVFDNSGSASDAAAQLGITTAELRRILEDPLLAPHASERGWT
jgi:hypothetical protein